MGEIWVRLKSKTILQKVYFAHFTLINWVLGFQKPTVLLRWNIFLD